MPRRAGRKENCIPPRRQGAKKKSEPQNTQKIFRHRFTQIKNDFGKVEKRIVDHRESLTTDFHGWTRIKKSSPRRNEEHEEIGRIVGHRLMQIKNDFEKEDNRLAWCT